MIARQRTTEIGRQDSPAGFSRIVAGSREVYLKRGMIQHAGQLVIALEQWRRRGEPGLGNRGSGFRLKVEGVPDLFARHCRRGGLIGAALGDVFVGFRPRPLAELAVADQAFKRAISVAEPIGAVIDWIGPALYRGFFITRAIAGMSLWDFIRTDDDPIVRRHVLEQARAAIATMHERGLCHADLNLHNLLVSGRDESFSVIILDLDKARMFDGPVPAALRRRTAARILRSARKLDHDGRFLDERELALLSGLPPLSG